MLQEVRFYENEFPATGDTVMIFVKSVGNFSAKVSLLEYGNLEGLVPFNDLTRARLRTIGKIIKDGSQEVMEVSRVDHAKGYVDLGKSKLYARDKEIRRDYYEKAKKVQKVMRRTAELTGVSFADVVEHVSWPMYKDHKHAFIAFEAISKGKEDVLKYTSFFTKRDEEETDPSKRVSDTLFKLITNEMAESKHRCRVNVEITNLTKSGVDAIRNVLLLGEESGMLEDPKMKIVAQIAASPHYFLTLETVDTKAGLDKLSNAVKVMEAEMEKYGGSVTLKNGMEPHVLNQKDKDKTDVIGCTPDDEEEEED
eukprot:Tbor_TRINITY_DN7548_c0_g1::TRINITY_DN7548_c0_g1_i1::g.922::m.922/K03237/EIF2S1; translation initiation factor 2 subunit 1